MQVCLRIVKNQEERRMNGPWTGGAEESDCIIYLTRISWPKGKTSNHEKNGTVNNLFLFYKSFFSYIMPRGRKRKFQFVPRPWIPNSSSEDEHEGQLPELRLDDGLHDRQHQGPLVRRGMLIIKYVRRAKIIKFNIFNNWIVSGK